MHKTSLLLQLEGSDKYITLDSDWFPGVGEIVFMPTGTYRVSEIKNLMDSTSESSAYISSTVAYCTKVSEGENRAEISYNKLELVELNKSEIRVINHLLTNADARWGEPFKDFDEPTIEEPEEIVRSLITKLTPLAR